MDQDSSGISNRLTKEVMKITNLPRQAARIAISMVLPDLTTLTITERCQRLGVHPGYFRTVRYRYRQEIRLFLQDQAEHILAEYLPAISYKVGSKALEGSVSHARLAYEVDGALSRGYKRLDKDDSATKRLSINILIAQHFQDRFQVDDGNGNKTSSRVALPAGQREETPLDVKVEAQAKVERHNARVEVSAGDD